MVDSNSHNISALTRRYISEHPSVKDCLRRGLVNYSALSREICQEYGETRFDAVLIACRRYFHQIQKQQPLDRKIITLLKKARISIRNRIAVAIIDKPRDFDQLYDLQRKVRRARGDFNLIEGEEAVVVITNSDYVDQLKSTFKDSVIKLTEDLAQVSMIFDERLETTRGVVAFVYGLLAENNVNVLEELSCWTDLMFVVAAEDAARVMKILTL